MMTLTSVSASGGPNVIALTRTSGFLTVNGDGSNVSVGGNGSGGTISGMTGADGATTGSGVYLDNAQNVTLRRMTINGTNQNYGVRGIVVSGIAVEYCTVAGTNGTNAATPFVEGSLRFTELTGSAAVTNCSISGAMSNNFAIVNTSGTLDRITITESTFGSVDPTNGESAVNIESTNSAVINPTVPHSTFTAARANHIARFVNSS